MVMFHSYVSHYQRVRDQNDLLWLVVSNIWIIFHNMNG